MSQSLQAGGCHRWGARTANCRGHHQQVPRLLADLINFLESVQQRPYKPEWHKLTFCNAVFRHS